MKSFPVTRLLSAAALAVSAILATPSQASPFSSLVVFGDSLSDSGNVASLGRYDPTQVISGNTYIPDNAYAFGTLSNGPVWATQFAGLIGLPLAPSAAPPLPYGGGSNYAFASARTGDASAGNAAPSLLDERDMYLGVSLGVADPTGLYVVAGGGNNARDALKTLRLRGTRSGPRGPTRRNTPPTSSPSSTRSKWQAPRTSLSGIRPTSRWYLRWPSVARLPSGRRPSSPSS